MTILRKNNYRKLLCLLFFAFNCRTASSQDVLSELKFQGKPLTTEEIKNITAECLNESNFDPVALGKALKRQKLPNYDSIYAKHLLCTYKKQGYVDDEGNIEFKQIEEFLGGFYGKGDVHRVREVCEKEQKGDTQEERTYSIAKCLIDTLHQIEKEQKEKSKKGD